mmetsp:Transcript_8266/g.16755  ORF Transcript_8266/g.16755 Transcript_8266/m.16755 type:complete len:84 (-) Transcript_8266:2010-2261(-)
MDQCSYLTSSPSVSFTSTLQGSPGFEMSSAMIWTETKVIPARFLLDWISHHLRQLDAFSFSSLLDTASYSARKSTLQGGSVVH